MFIAILLTIMAVTVSALVYAVVELVKAHKEIDYSTYKTGELRTNRGKELDINSNFYKS